MTRGLLPVDLTSRDTLLPVTTYLLFAHRTYVLHDTNYGSSEALQVAKFSTTAA